MDINKLSNRGLIEFRFFILILVCLLLFGYYFLNSNKEKELSVSKTKKVYSIKKELPLIKKDFYNPKQDITPIKKSIKKSSISSSLILFKSLEVGTSIYDIKGRKIGESNEKGVFETLLPKNKSVTLFFKHKNHDSKSITLTPNGEMEIHYIN